MTWRDYSTHAAFVAELARRSSFAPEGQYRHLVRQAVAASHLRHCPQAAHQFRLIGDELLLTIGDFGPDEIDLAPILAAIATASKIDITIDSGGGSIRDAARIAEALAAKQCSITGTIRRCHSSAWLPAMVCRPLRMHAGTSGMVHGSKHCVFGDVSDFQAGIRLLEETNVKLEHAFRERTRQPEEVIRDWLSKDTWFTPEQALAAGLIDEVIPAAPSVPQNFAEPKSEADDWKVNALISFCRSLGTIETDKAAFFRNLDVWFCSNVKDVAQGNPPGSVAAGAVKPPVSNQQ